LLTVKEDAASNDVSYYTTMNGNVYRIDMLKNNKMVWKTESISEFDSGGVKTIGEMVFEKD
jgi:hypothetical protein